MITITNLRKSFGDRVLFDGADLRIGARERVALVGPNGAGKTTLLEMILGAAGIDAAVHGGTGRGQSPDSGVVRVTNDARVGYLPQEAERLRGRSVLEEVVSAGEAMQRAGHRVRVLEHELQEVEDPAEKEALLAEYAEVLGRFEELGGYTVEAEARRVLGGLGFTGERMEGPTDALSGGWLMRAALAKLLVSSPDVLLLDEPTNHLDLASVQWLEGFLRGHHGAVLLVSHDRDFMNATCGRIVELANGSLDSYPGDFETFVTMRAERQAQAERAAKDQAKEIAKIETFVNRFRYKASKAKQVQSRVKALDKMERVETGSKDHRRMGVGFPVPPRSGRVVAELDGVRFGYGDTLVYDGLDLEIERGEKIVLAGPNGAGKTTLLKLLAGVLEPSGGERRWGHNVSVGYFAQHQLEALHPELRVIDELTRSLPPGSTARPRDLLGRFLFSGSDAEKPVRVLSGGEKTRLALAKLLCEPHNLLCLDEPTNHLDMASRDALEAALTGYEGTVVLITHDRHLIRSVVDRVIEIVSGVVTDYPGDWELYRWRKEQAEAERPAERTTQTPKRTDRVDPKERRRLAADRRARLKTYRGEVKAIEAELEELGTEAAHIEQRLADPSVYGSEEGPAIVRRHGEVRARITELEAAWESAASALERAEAQEAEGA